MIDNAETQMVLVTVGTDHHPFDRLVRWVDRWLVSRIDVHGFFQTGTSAPPVSAPWEAYFGYEELVALMATANVVVCHGGPATIMDARAAGIRPIVMPRQPAFGEHVDNHQVLFSRRLARLGEITLAESGAELLAALDDAVVSPERCRLSNGTNDVNCAVASFQDIAQGLMRRRPHPWLRRTTLRQAPTGRLPL